MPLKEPTKAPRKEPTLGDFLRAARTRKGMSLRAVERATGISNAYLSQLESGKIRQPSPQYLHALSEVYSISYVTLSALAGHPVPGAAEDDARLPTFACRLGPVTDDEEEKLIEYLDFLRSRGSRKGGR